MRLTVSLILLPMVLCISKQTIYNGKLRIYDDMPLKINCPHKKQDFTSNEQTKVRGFCKEVPNSHFEINQFIRDANQCTCLQCTSIYLHVSNYDQVSDAILTKDVTWWIDGEK